ncbi:hypothetical protein VHEMI09228 [[Torrubiella] hemipterigena]|uniref:Heme haloperoxidase family profile domain-containing protein n=1 Tax=[Torrubiella] hemipterigena TaxID=1531966 RepID=A0A0A1TR63_9HYPO|nr:hypothetical protein VHEMI09228 [[Torrubiella] hemipterigena]
MVSMRAVLASGLLATVAALPGGKPVDFSQWKPAGPNDARAPCPALNSLANHGFLPHNGRGITLPMLQKVLSDVLNVDNDLSNLFFGGAVGMGLSKDLFTLDLDALIKHNAIEHDGSLSRQDNFAGNNHSFNQTIFDSWLAQIGDTDVITTALAGKARMYRVKTEQARDPEFKYGQKQQLISNGESALIMGIFGDIYKGDANKSWVKVFFEQERLPYNEGWRRPQNDLNLLNTAGMIAQMLIASGETLTDVATVTESTVRDALLWLVTHWNE